MATSDLSTTTPSDGLAAAGYQAAWNEITLYRLIQRDQITIGYLLVGAAIATVGPAYHLGLLASAVIPFGLVYA